MFGGVSEGRCLGERPGGSVGSWERTEAECQDGGKEEEILGKELASLSAIEPKGQITRLQDTERSQKRGH